MELAPEIASSFKKELKRAKRAAALFWEWLRSVSLGDNMERAPEIASSLKKEPKRAERAAALFWEQLRSFFGGSRYGAGSMPWLSEPELAPGSENR